MALSCFGVLTNRIFLQEQVSCVSALADLQSNLVTERMVSYEKHDLETISSFFNFPPSHSICLPSSSGPIAHSHAYSINTGTSDASRKAT
jgi:hypothetical protein